MGKQFCMEFQRCPYVRHLNKVIFLLQYLCTNIGTLDETKILFGFFGNIFVHLNIAPGADLLLSCLPNHNGIFIFKHKLIMCLSFTVILHTQLYNSLANVFKVIIQRLTYTFKWVTPTIQSSIMANITRMPPKLHIYSMLMGMKISLYDWNVYNKHVKIQQSLCAFRPTVVNNIGL